MRLSLKLREVPLLPGVLLRCEPLDGEAYQRWTTVCFTAAMGAAPPAERVRELLGNKEAMAAMRDIVARHVKQVEGLTLELPDGTTRPAVPADLPVLGGLVPSLLGAVMALFTQSSLSKEDLGNSPALPPPSPSATTAPPTS